MLKFITLTLLAFLCTATPAKADPGEDLKQMVDQQSKALCPTASAKQICEIEFSTLRLKILAIETKLTGAQLTGAIDPKKVDVDKLGLEIKTSLFEIDRDFKSLSEKYKKK